MVTLEELQVLITPNTKGYYTAMQDLEKFTRGKLTALERQLKFHTQAEVTELNKGNIAKAEGHRKATRNILSDYKKFTNDYLNQLKTFAQQVKRIDPLTNPGGGKGGGGRDDSGLGAAIPGFMPVGGRWTQAISQFTRNAIPGLGPIGVLGTVAAGLIIDKMVEGIIMGAQKVGELVVDSVTKAAEFERLSISLAAVEGGASIAAASIARLEKTAINTPGLTFRGAIEGYQRLRAVAFSAEQAEKAVVGLSKVKILSGSTNQDLQAVLVNFAQIRSMGRLTGDELRETLGRMPYFAQILEKAFGTINTKRIAELGLSSDEFFEAIFKQMKELPEVSGGAANAFEKLQDELYKAQIAFGKPFLEPLTKALQGLTKTLQSPEMKAAWEDWGQWAADAASGAYISMKQLVDYASFVRGGIGNESAGGRMVNDLASMGLGFGIGGPVGLGTVGLFQSGRNTLNALASWGKEERLGGHSEEFVKKRAAREKETQAAIDALNEVRRIQNEVEEKRDEEIERHYKKRQEDLERSLQERSTALDSSYAREQAVLEGFHRRNEEEELRYQQASLAASTSNARGKLALMEEEVAAQQALNAQQIAIAPAMLKQKRQEAMDRQMLPKLIALEKERSAVILLEAKNAAALQKAQEALNNSNRQATIALLEFQANVEKFTADSDIFRLEEQLKKEAIGVEEGFAQIRAITEQEYDRLTAITRQRQAEELNNMALTTQERYNLEQKHLLELEQLKEDQYRKSLSLDDRYWQAYQARTARGIAEVRNFIDAFSDIGSSAGSVVDSFLGQQITNALRLSESLQKVSVGYKEVLGQIEANVNIRRRELYDLLAPLEKKVESGEVLSPDEIARRNAADAELRIMFTQVQIVRRFSGEVQTAHENVANLFKEIASGGITAESAYDELIRRNVTLSGAVEKVRLQAELQMATDLRNAKREQVNAGMLDPASLADYELKVLSATLALKDFETRQLLAGQAAETLSNLLLVQANLLGKDPSTVLVIQGMARANVLKETNALLVENIALETEYYKNSEYVAAKRNNALLNLNKEVWEAEQEAITRTELAYQKMQMTADLSMNQVLANVAEFLESQANMTDIMSNTVTGAMQSWFDTIDKGFSMLVERLGLADTALGDFIQNFLAGLAKLAAQKFFTWLIGAVFGAASGGVGAGVPGMRGTATAPGGVPFFRAAGGPVSAGSSYFVGEEGPEIFTPNVSGKILSTEDSWQVLKNGRGSAAPMVNNFNFYANPQTGRFSHESGEQAVRRMIEMQQKAAARHI